MFTSLFCYYVCIHSDHTLLSPHSMMLWFYIEYKALYKSFTLCEVHILWCYKLWCPLSSPAHSEDYTTVQWSQVSVVMTPRVIKSAVQTQHHGFSLWCRHTLPLTVCLCLWCSAVTLSYGMMMSTVHSFVWYPHGRLSCYMISVWCDLVIPTWFRVYLKSVVMSNDDTNLQIIQQKRFTYNALMPHTFMHYINLQSTNTFLCIDNIKHHFYRR